MLTYGAESIAVQKDTRFLKQLENYLDEAFDIINLSIPDIVASNGENFKSYEQYDDYKKKLKDNMLTKTLNNISKLLSNRFGLKIEAFNKTIHNDMVSIITPPLNSKVLNSVMDNLDSLFPKKQVSSILWNVIATKNEQILYTNLRDIRDAIKSNEFTLDLKEAKIKGLDKTTIVINIDFIRAYMFRLKPSELTALILQKVGILFSKLEYMYTTTSNNYVLLDTFINERFNKQTPSLDAIKIAIDKTDADVKVNTGTPKAFLETLDMYMLKTYRMDDTKRTIKLDLQVLSDEFVTQFEYGPELSKALIKVKTFTTVKVDETNTVLSLISDTFHILIFISMVVMSILFFSIFGILALLITAGIVILKLVIGYLIDVILSIGRTFFATDVNTDMNEEILIRRLKHIKLDIIKQLRSNMSKNKTEDAILVEQIDEVKKSLSFIEKKTGLLYSYGESPIGYKNQDFNQIQNEFIEQMSENELHYFKAKFKNV